MSFCLFSPPALGDDGRFYATAGEDCQQAYDRGVIKLEPGDFTKLWGPVIPPQCRNKHRTNNMVGKSGVSVGNNGLVYAVGDWNECRNGLLFAFDSTDGSVAWGPTSCSSAPHPRQVPALDEASSRLLMGTDRFCSFDMGTGTTDWSVETTSSYIGNNGLAIDSNGNVAYSTYLGGSESYPVWFGGLDASSGALLWSGGFPTGGQQAPRVDAATGDGLVLLTDRHADLLRALDVDAEGDEVFALPGLSRPVVDAAGNLYAGDEETGHVVSTTASGTQRWRKPLPGAGGALVDFLDDEGHLYVRQGASLFALDAATGAVVWRFDAGANLHVASRLTAEGKLFVQDEENTAYLLDTALAYAPSPWPIARFGNRRHTRKVNDVQPMPCSDASRPFDPQLTRFELLQPDYPERVDELVLPPESGVVDGNQVRIRAKWTNCGGPGSADLVLYDYDGTEMFRYPRTFSAGGTFAYSPLIDTLGFAWKESGSGAVPQLDPYEYRGVVEVAGMEVESRNRAFEVLPRPVVLVHGLWSEPCTWAEYSQLDGCGPGSRNFIDETHERWSASAVGGMNTGSISWNELTSIPVRILECLEDTSIATNANKLRAHVDTVRREHRARQIDIVAHSMGGLISRQYIHSYMPVAEGQPAVFKLLTLGTPFLGSPCAAGILGCDVAELDPDVTERLLDEVPELRGVSVSTFAGDPYSFFPCALRLIDNDSVVTVPSAHHESPDPTTLDIKHTSMTGSPQVFSTFVRPKLALTPAAASGLTALQARTVTTPAEAVSQPVQLLLAEWYEVVSGDVAEVNFTVPAASELGVNLVAPAIVGASLADPSGGLFSEEAGQLIRSFHVAGPSAGEWTLSLANGGTEDLAVRVSALITGNPLLLELEVGEPTPDRQVHLTATLTEGGLPVTGAQMTAELTGLDGSEASFQLFDDGLHEDGTAGDGVYGGGDESQALNYVAYRVVLRAAGLGFNLSTTGSIPGPPAGACGFPTSVQLSGQIVQNQREYVACSSITAEAEFVVGAGGDLTLRAGNEVVLGNGVTVDTAGSLEVVNDADLQVP